MVAVLLLTGCGGPAASPPEQVAAAAPSSVPGVTVIDGPAMVGDGAERLGVGSAWYRPAVGVTWQWQLTGRIDTGYDVDLYDIDLFDSPDRMIDELHADGRRVLCYFSAGSVEDWRDDAGDFPAAAIGRPMDGWAGERWLDVREPAVLSVLEARLDLAVRRGCDGVEPDNVNGYENRTGFELTEADQVAFNRSLAALAHERGLAVALKNAPGLVDRLVGSFDLSVTEECHQYGECEAYLPFVEAGKPVLNAEYADRFVTDPAARRAMCEATAAIGIVSLVLPLDLDDSFRHAC